MPGATIIRAFLFFINPVFDPALGHELGFCLLQGQQTN